MKLDIFILFSPIFIPYLLKEALLIGSMRLHSLNGFIFIQVGENCAQCFSSEKHSIDTSILGAVIRSFDLNDAQEEGVLSCIAARECSHKNTVKLIWGPPGTGKTKTASSLLFSLLKRRC